MSKHFIGPGHEPHLFIIIESEGYDGDDLREESFGNRQAAEEHLESVENKSYMICIESIGGGMVEVTIEPHT